MSVFEKMDPKNRWYKVKSTEEQKIQELQLSFRIRYSQRQAAWN